MQTARLKYIVDYQKGKVPKIFSDDASLFPYLSMEYLRGKKGNTQYVEENGKYLLVEENEVLVLWDGANAGEVMLSKKGYLSSTMSIMKPDENIFHKGFFYYFLKEKEQFFKDMANGTTIPHLDQDAFFNKHYKILPYNLQLTINNYLDTQTKKIKTFINKKQTFINLLKEQRQSIIDNAVTKGLNKNVKFKNTGIDWLGDIPEHWEVRRLKFTSNIIYGVSPNEKTYNDKGIGSILINGPVEYSKEDFGITRSLKWTTAPQKFAKKDSLLFCLRGSTTGRLNICHTDVSIGRGVAAIMGELFSQEYLSFVMMAMRKSIEYSFKGSTFPSVNSGVLNNYYVAVPPKTEQEQILKKIKTETNKIDQAISKAAKEIALIQEYQKAMIAEAVLGKIMLND